MKAFSKHIYMKIKDFNIKLLLNISKNLSRFKMVNNSAIFHVDIYFFFSKSSENKSNGTAFITFALLILTDLEYHL